MARILVTDDDEVLRGALRVVLEAAGYDVVEANDGEAGLRVQREQGADLVLMDIFMPERDRLEVIRALHAETPPPAHCDSRSIGRRKAVMTRLAPPSSAVH